MHGADAGGSPRGVALLRLFPLTGGRGRSRSRWERAVEELLAVDAIQEPASLPFSRTPTGSTKKELPFPPSTLKQGIPGGVWSPRSMAWKCCFHPEIKLSEMTFDVVPGRGGHVIGSPRAYFTVQYYDLLIWYRALVVVGRALGGVGPLVRISRFTVPPSRVESQTRWTSNSPGKAHHFFPFFDQSPTQTAANCA